MSSNSIGAFNLARANVLHAPLFTDGGLPYGLANFLKRGQGQILRDWYIRRIVKRLYPLLAGVYNEGKKDKSRKAQNEFQQTDP